MHFMATNRTIFRRVLILVCGITLTAFASSNTGPLNNSNPSGTGQDLSDGRTSNAPVGRELLPPLANNGETTRRKQVLSHLGSAIRYYRVIVSIIQPVGEPADALYREEAIADATQAVAYALEYGRGEAKLIDAYDRQRPLPKSEATSAGETQKVQTAKSEEVKRIEKLRAKEDEISEALKKASADQVVALKLQQEKVQDALKLTSEFNDALAQVAGISDNEGGAGLRGDVERLARTVPEIAHPNTKPIQTSLLSFGAESSAGITSQARVFVELLETKQALARCLQQTESLHNEAVALMVPLGVGMRNVVLKGQESSLQQPQDTLKVNPESNTFNSVEATFNLYKDAGVPLGQEIITLEQGRENLQAWRISVDGEYRGVLRAFILRISVILFVLALLFALGVIWKRSTTMYVHDVRRRRQLMGMRRLVIGFLSTLVVLFGFVTQFKSLATFAGFITAGLAVGLQTILLSVAAYFFIIGRYGVRVGDRITIAGVTGDVIEVGLVRFYLTELAGSGAELDPTGRVAAFSNAVLFQAGTPLFKQVPGIAYVWHELNVKLVQSGDYQHAAEELSRLINAEYEGYRKLVEEESRSMELWMDTWMLAPRIEARLQLVEGGLELLVRYPVKMRDAAKVDERLTRAVLQLLGKDDKVKQAVTALPTIKTAAKT